MCSQAGQMLYLFINCTVIQIKVTAASPVEPGK
jgi:hypothetical protein